MFKERGLYILVVCWNEGNGLLGWGIGVVMGFWEVLLICSYCFKVGVLVNKM